MGYEIERFIDQKIIEDFKCGICSKVFIDPVMISVCQHSFCRECITDWLKTDRSCPEDREPIEASQLMPPVRIVRNVYNKLEIKCEFANEGCEKVVPLGRLNAHSNECSYNKITECVKDCGFEGTRNQLKEHDCVEYLKGIIANLEVRLYEETSKELEDSQEYKKKSNEENWNENATCGTIEDEQRKRQHFYGDLELRYFFAVFLQMQCLQQPDAIGRPSFGKNANYPKEPKTSINSNWYLYFTCECPGFIRFLKKRVDVKLVASARQNTSLIVKYERSKYHSPEMSTYDD